MEIGVNDSLSFGVGPFSGKATSVLQGTRRENEDTSIRKNEEHLAESRRGKFATIETEAVKGLDCLYTDLFPELSFPSSQFVGEYARIRSQSLTSGFDFNSIDSTNTMADVELSSPSLTVDKEQLALPINEFDDVLCNIIGSEPSLPTTGLDRAGKIMPEMKMDFSDSGSELSYQADIKCVESELVAPFLQVIPCSSEGFVKSPRSSTCKSSLHNVITEDTSLSKNAIAARENRIKKKMYVQTLEKNSKELGAENKKMKNQVVSMKSMLRSLQKEVDYLRDVLANQSELASLLMNIQSTGMKLATSINSKAPTKRMHAADCKQSCKCHACKKENLTSTEVPSRPTTRLSKRQKLGPCSAQPPCKQTPFPGRSPLITSKRNSAMVRQDPTGGVCLHVSSGRISVEFCPQCSENASQVALDHCYGLPGNRESGAESDGDSCASDI
ncbi:PREDICTED: uncharacterized protein LOC106808142 [Priapulus caudatus]|uniref:Uncharacterized protein LOC106808142 n=1 Tax=Priapulus caudatus TaxID=37621 RepID=A0ABM1E1Y9_PRICU|nr:PREDICTED: uncharacterized protein LOC106808142 [Priapulus caudatus]